MASKTFETLFKIGAKYTGSPAFAALNRDVDKTQRNVKDANAGFVKMFAAVTVGVGTAIAGFRLFEKAAGKAMEFGKFAFDAAKEQKKAHDMVRQSYGKLVQQGRLRAADLQKEIEATIKLSEAMAKAGGIDAEVLEVGLAGLSKYFSSKQINAMAKGYQDWLVTVSKGEPHLENVADLNAKIFAWISKGRGQVLMETGMTKEDLAAINKRLKGLPENQRAMERAAIAAKHFGKETGATARWMETDEGKAFKAANAFEDLGETVGGPLVAAQREMNIALKELYVALQPVADLIAAELSPRMKDLSKWVSENKDKIVELGNALVVFSARAADAMAAAGKAYLEYYNTVSDLSFKLTDQWIQSIDDTSKQWDTLCKNLTSGMQAAWAGIQDIWGQMSKWFDENVVQPILKLWDKLVQTIAPMWERMTKPLGGAPLSPEATKAAEEGLRSTGGYPTAAPPTTTTSEAAKQAQELSSRGGYPTPPASAAATAASVGALADVRAKYAEELQNPRVQQLLMASTQAEVGDQPENTQQAYMESVMNRAAARGKTLEQIISDPGYYPATTTNKLGRTFAGPQAAKMQELIGRVTAGSNVANYATGNESGGVHSGGANVAYNPRTGERFVHENPDVGWVKSMQKAASLPVPATAPTISAGPTAPIVPTGSKLKDMIKGINIQQRVSGAESGTNVASNPVINIHGVNADRTGAVGQEVTRALQGHTRDFLTQIKQARSYEDRLGYV